MYRIVGKISLEEFAEHRDSWLGGLNNRGPDFEFDVSALYHVLSSSEVLQQEKHAQINKQNHSNEHGT